MLLRIIHISTTQNNFYKINRSLAARAARVGWAQPCHVRIGRSRFVSGIGTLHHIHISYTYRNIQPCMLYQDWQHFFFLLLFGCPCALQLKLDQQLLSQHKFVEYDPLRHGTSLHIVCVSVFWKRNATTVCTLCIRIWCTYMVSLYHWFLFSRMAKRSRTSKLCKTVRL